MRLADAFKRFVSQAPDDSGRCPVRGIFWGLLLVIPLWAGLILVAVAAEEVIRACQVHL